MKSILSALLSILLTLFCLQLQAADLIVEENAVSPNFATIQSAIDSADPGDRIFVKNKLNEIPWFEDLVIVKPVSLLAFDADTNWRLVGNLTIAPDAANFSDTVRTITIIGLWDNVGSINTNPHVYSGTIKLNVFSCQLNSGNIDFDDNGYECHVASNLLKNGFLEIGYGIVSGNQVNGSITISDPDVKNGDTTFVVGNRMINEGNGYPGELNWENGDQFIYIANNYIRSNGNSTQAIDINTIRSGNGGHTIVNNSIESGGGYTDGITLTNIGAGIEFRIENNAFHDQVDGEFSFGEYMISFGSVSNTAIVIVNYNVYQGYEDGKFNNNPFNVFEVGNVEASNSFDLNDTTGLCTAPECVDMGSVGNQHTDLDLTRNDVGVSGGSFNYTNFWPLNLNGSARVYLVKTPRSVVQGETIDAEADAYDR